MTGAEIAGLIISILGIFYGGAVTEAETNGEVTKSINYIYEVNATEICKDKKTYPKIIVSE